MLFIFRKLLCLIGWHSWEICSKDWVRETGLNVMLATQASQVAVQSCTRPGCRCKRAVKSTAWITLSDSPLKIRWHSASKQDINMIRSLPLF